jgi:hypothetical protein
MSPNRSRHFSRRDVLRWTAALPAVALASRLSPATAAQATPAPVTDAAIAELVAGNTAFAFDLYAALRREAASNLIFSP